uniref:Hydrolase_4 domain-containing protein n=1 Tax=Strongyloides stercoralis TaxID=6248 RepID=A0A0K0EI41_STRER
MNSINNSISSNRGKKSKDGKQVKNYNIIGKRKYKTIKCKKSIRKSKKEIFDNLRSKITEVRSIKQDDIIDIKSFSCFLNEASDATQECTVKNTDQQLDISQIDETIRNEENYAIKLKFNKSKLENLKNNITNVTNNAVPFIENKKTCYFDENKAINIREECKKLANSTLECKKELFYKKREIRPLLLSSKQKLYLEILKDLDNEKFSLPCRCPSDAKESTFIWFSKKGKILKQVIASVVKILFDKRRGKSFYERSAFWPCLTEYFFYKTNDNIVLNDSLQVKQDKTFLLPDNEGVLPLNKKDFKEKVLKAQYYTEYEGLYSFGYNHPCYRNEDPIHFFFVKSNNDTLACAFVKYFTRAKYLIIFSHPNGTDISDSMIGFPNILDFARFMEVNLISYDYSGYGISNGIPSQNTLVGNLQSILEYAKNTLNYPEERIILWGYSLGGALSSLVAKNNKNIGGLILYGAPASIKAVIKTKVFKKKIIKDKYITNTPFSTAEAVKEVECPTLIIHSKNDSLISHIHGLKIFQNCKTPVLPLLLEKSKHDYMDVADEGWKKIREFLEYEIAYVHSDNSMLSLRHLNINSNI